MDYVYSAFYTQEYGRYGDFVEVAEKKILYKLKNLGIIEKKKKNIEKEKSGNDLCKFKVTTDAIPTVYQPGEAFAQLVVVPVEILEPVFVEELSETERGTMGFGEADEKVYEKTES